MSVVAWKLGTVQPKQAEFYKAKAARIGFGGARGGGKSHAVRKKAVMLCLHYPGIRVLIVRRTYPLLKSNHIDELVAETKGIARYVKQDKELKFVNGSTIFFKYCDTDADADNYQGLQFDVIFLDEAGHLREEWIKKILATCRGANLFPHRVYFTMNPGGESHGYMKRLFIDRRYEELEVPEDHYYIQSLVTDNAALMEAMPEYVQYLEGLPYKLRQAWRYGSWDILEGVFFEEFRDDPAHYADRELTHVIEPFAPQRHWPIYRSFDWGRAKPYCCLWWTIDHEGIAYAILESYGMGREPNEGIKWDADQVFEHISEVERTHPWLKGKEIQGVADPSIWKKDGGSSVYDAAVQAGVYFSRADNERIPGWLQCHYRLRFDQDGFPMMYIFKNCKHLIRTIPLQMYHKTKVEDLDSDLEDHACVVGGTVIATPEGGSQIESLIDTIGYVIGHDGLPHKYTGCALTKRNAEVWTLTTEDGRSVTATPDHPFLTADGSWKRMDGLRPGDGLWEVQVCESTASQQSSKSTAGRSTTCAETTFSARGSGCTGRFGRKQMAGRSPMATTSTTLTETGQTTRRRTWRLSGAASIYRFTARVGKRLRSSSNTWSASDRSPLNGIGLQKGGSGTGNTLSNNGKNESPRRTPAPIVARSSSRSVGTEATAFAQTIASLPTAGRKVMTMLFARAKAAEKSVSSTNTASQGFVQSGAPIVKSIEPAGYADVYNMTVEGSRSYIANGIAVHNCDAMRYFCMMHPITPALDAPKPEKPQMIDPLAGETKIGRYRRAL